MSNEPMLRTPTMSQIRLAVDGNTRSGVVVAQIRRSTSFGAVPVFSSYQADLVQIEMDADGDLLRCKKKFRGGWFRAMARDERDGLGHAIARAQTLRQQLQRIQRLSLHAPAAAVGGAKAVRRRRTEHGEGDQGRGHCGQPDQTAHA